MDFSFLTSRDFEPAFWTPERLDRHSAWWGHVPFAFWLVANIEPRLLVELGTHHGVSYAAFCETVLRRRLATRCYAVDSWTGDAHAGAYEEGVYADLKEFHDEHYASFSQLVRRTFDEASDDFADGSIDLLHIDGYHTYEAVRHDFDTWRPKLSDRAVAIFHDTNERQRDFGVWRFLAELKQEVPVFEFLHSHGLGIAAIGGRSPEAAKWLCGLADECEIVAVRGRFSALGARWQAVQEKSGIDAQARKLQSHAHALEDTLRQKEAQVQALITERRDELARQLTEARSEFERQLAEARSEFERELAEARSECRNLVDEANRNVARADDTVVYLARRYEAGSRPAPRTRFRDYLRVGPKERKELTAIRNSPLFDADFYLNSNPDVGGSGMDAASHYLHRGGREGRDPSPYFSTHQYLINFPDVAESGLNALAHYEIYGRHEMRRISPLRTLGRSTAS